MFYQLHCIYNKKGSASKQNCFCQLCVFGGTEIKRSKTKKANDSLFSCLTQHFVGPMVLEAICQFPYSILSERTYKSIQLAFYFIAAKL